MSYQLTPEEQAMLDDVFTYHEPTGDKNRRYKDIRIYAKDFAAAILRNTPKSADQSAAIRKVREAMMTANAAIALEK